MFVQGGELADGSVSGRHERTERKAVCRGWLLPALWDLFRGTQESEVPFGLALRHLLVKPTVWGGPQTYSLWVSGWEGISVLMPFLNEVFAFQNAI
jgi:hypothetical protein